MSITVSQTATQPKLEFAVEVRAGRGSSRHTVTLDPALLARLTSGSTVSGEAFYYISQRSERTIAFMQQEVVDQRVIAVYFDKNRRVQRLANYGIKDGRLFDFVSRSTPTSGRELNYLQALFQGLQFRL